MRSSTAEQGDHARSPAGEAVAISGGGYDAEVVEVGAGLRRLRRDGVDIIDGYDEDEMCSSGRGQLLAPWPNRIADGTYDFHGSSYQLALTEPVKQNAIHGLTRWSNWVLLERSASMARYGYQLRPQPGYPFSLELELEYALSAAGLRVVLTAANVGAGPAPYGHGAHPYLTVGAAVDGCVLELPASRRGSVDDRGLPIARGTEPVAGTGLDFRSPRPIGDTRLDHPFTGLLRGPDGVTRVTLTNTDATRSVSLWADSAYPWLQVFTGDTVKQRPRQALAVEPMTCPPDAFNSGVDLVVLWPGDRHVGTFGIG